MPAAQGQAAARGGMAMQDNGISLKSKLHRAERMGRLKAYGLILPLLLFILVTFLAPIAMMLFESVDNPAVVETIPKTVAAVKLWNHVENPSVPEALYATLAEELKRGTEAGTVSKLATRLNYEHDGMRTLIMRTARKVDSIDAGPWKDQFLTIDQRWAKQETWALIQQYGEPYTLGYYLDALDLHYDAKGAIVRQPEDIRLYLDVFGRTIWMSVLVTTLCILLGYPVAYLLTNLPARTSNLLMILVLLPFWTSLLVRTTAWVVILQSNGLLNDFLIRIGLIDHRVQLIFNRFGVIVTMTQILLPFMILSLYSVMKNISPVYVRAARSLGANPVLAFWRVYVPQTVPGIGAGGLLVFILALGYYITPALVGGPNDQMASYFIADNVNRSLNWGLASALGGLLLAGVMGLYVIYNRLVGVNAMKLG